MRIVNRKEFLTMPIGTVYTEYEPCILRDLKVKNETWENDWLYTSFDMVEADDSVNGYEYDSFDKLMQMQEKGISGEIEKSIARDGMFEEDQLFMIYEKNDIDYIIKCLTDYANV